MEIQNEKEDDPQYLVKFIRAGYGKSVFIVYASLNK